jgi:DNA-binding LytR/AlgR family response regulator
MIRCMIVDDEPLAIDVLRRYIEAVPALTLVATFQKPMEVFEALVHTEVDILFLDIEMPGLTGLALTRSLSHPPQIIFTTAFREYAAEGFDLQALDYLVKPVSYERFLKAINKYQNIVNVREPAIPTEETFIFLKADKEMVKLKYDDVLFVEGLKNYARIKTQGKDLIVYYTLSYLEDKFPAKHFKRVHRSFIINLGKVDKFVSGSVDIAGKIIPIGKTYQEEVEKVLKKRLI